MRLDSGDLAYGVTGSVRFFANGVSAPVSRQRLRVIVQTVRSDVPLSGSFSQRFTSDPRVIFVSGGKILKANAQRQGSFVVRVTVDLDEDGVVDAGEPSVNRTGQWRRPIAFGDSYSSGEGAGDYDDDSKSSQNSCHRSPHAYARKLNVPAPGRSPFDGLLSDVRLYSCSGARAYTMNSTVLNSDNLRTAEQKGILAMNNLTALPASESDSKGPNENTTNEKRQVLRFRDEIKSIGSFVAQPDYITVGVGGNDMEFGNYLTKYCLRKPKGGTGPCGPNDSWTPADQLDNSLFPGITTFGAFVDRKLQITIERMSRSIDEILAESGTTPVVLMGYPMLFGAVADTDFSSSTACMVAGYLWGGSASYFRTKQVEVNNAMRALAQRKGIHFVDLLPVYDSARAGMCGKGGAGINNFAFSQSNFAKNCVRVGVAVASGNPGQAQVAGGAIIESCLAIELAQNDFEFSAFAAQSHAHPNSVGQELNAVAIAPFMKQATGPRTSTGIPKNPAAVVAIANAVQQVAVSDSESRFEPANELAVVRKQLSVGGSVSTSLFQVNSGWIGTVTVDVPRCQRSAGLAFPIRFGGVGSSPQVLKLVDVGSGEVLLTLTATPESTLSAVLPATAVGRLLQVRGGVGVTSSQTFDVTASPAPCAAPDYVSGPAGQSTQLNVLANDGTGAYRIADFRSNVPWIAVSGDGVLIVANPPLRTEGTVSFSYSSCSSAGDCTSTGGTFQTTRPACTVTASLATPSLEGTAGDDVICADESTVEVQAGAGNDLIYVRGPVTVINSGSGVDRIFADGTIVLVSPEEDLIQSTHAILRLSIGKNPGFPTSGTPLVVDTTPPTVQVATPAIINVGDSVSASVTCNDPGGAASCPSTVDLVTQSAGDFFGTVTASDTAGNQTLETFWYTVSNPIVTITTTTTTTTTSTTTTTTPAPTTTVVPASTFRARNGVAGSGEIVDRIFVERSVSVGEYDPDGDGWVLVGRTNGDGDNGVLARFWVEGGVPMVASRHPQKGCLQSTPQSLDPVKKGQTRLLREVARDTALCRSASPESDVDGDGIADNVQPVYRARNGNAAAGELASRVFVERNRNAAEAQLGVSDYDPDGDGWALVGRTNGQIWATVSSVFSEPLVLKQGSVCRHFSFDTSTVRSGQTRIVTTGAQVTCPS